MIIASSLTFKIPCRRVHIRIQQSKSKVNEISCIEQDHMKKHITITVNFIDDDDAPFFSNFLRSYFMCYVECT